MTYLEGRTPLTSDDMARMHPSTWEAECEMQRARVAKLEEALSRFIEIAEQCDLPEWAGYHMDEARAALQEGKA